MKAVLLTDYGGVEKLVVSEVPEPPLGPSDVKVRVFGASVNPVDLKLRRGDLRGVVPLELPAILGRDASGVVVEVGRDVSAFAPGDHVMSLVDQAYAEIVVAPEEAFAKLPPGLDVVDAAALPLVGLTGVELVDETLGAKRGDVVLVTGAVGNVGRVAVFALKRRGAVVIAGVRAEQIDQAAMLDPDDVVAVDDEEHLDDVPSLDAIADTVDGDVADRLLSRLKPGGTFGTVLSPPKRAASLDVNVRTLLAHRDPKRLAELGEDVARGALEVPVEKRYSLEEVRAAHEMAEQRGVGKILLVTNAGARDA